MNLIVFAWGILDYVHVPLQLIWDKIIWVCSELSISGKHALMLSWEDG